MRISLAVAVVSCMLISRADGSQQKSFPSARIAALDFALSNGIDIDRANTVVIAESFYMSSHAPKSVSTADDRERSAEAMAKFLGGSVTVAAASAVLQCRSSYCAASGQRAVLEITEPASTEGDQGILVSLYLPTTDRKAAPRGTLTSMTLTVRKQGTGWVAVAKKLGPNTVRIRS